MGMFSNNTITDVGKMLLADVQAGAVFIPTRIVVGSGSLPRGVTTQSMTDVITPVKSLAINKKKRTPDGKCIFGGVYTNEEITEPFYFRELSLYARAAYLNEDGSVKIEIPEILYSYGNAGATADYMPAYSTSTVVEKHIDLVTWVGNDAEVDLTIDSGIFVTQDQTVLNMKFISPDTVGYTSLLAYMISIYDQNIIVCGHISGFTDMPEGVTIMHGTINVVGGQLSVYGNTRTAFYYRGTNSLTEWTSDWRKAYDTTEDLTIDKAIPAVKLKSPNGTGSFFKNANATNDLGTTISDETKDGIIDRINLSAARTLAEKMRLVVGGEKIYNILHTGNKELIKPADIGAAPQGHVSKVYQAFSDADIENAMLDAYNLTADVSIGYFAIYSNLENLMLGGGVWHLTVYRRDAYYGIIEANSYDTKSTRKMVRCRYEGVFQPIAWDNPPMAQGIEYRTTERFHNEVVYKKIDANGNILWRKESESTWRLLSAASYVSPASVE